MSPRRWQSDLEMVLKVDKKKTKNAIHFILFVSMASLRRTVWGERGKNGFVVTTKTIQSEMNIPGNRRHGALWQQYAADLLCVIVLSSRIQSTCSQIFLDLPELHSFPFLLLYSGKFPHCWIGKNLLPLLLQLVVPSLVSPPLLQINVKQDVKMNYFDIHKSHVSISHMTSHTMKTVGLIVWS